LVSIVTPLTVAVIVLVPAVVELNVPVITPSVPVVPGDVRVLPGPVAESVTGAPLTAFPKASLTVTVIVETLSPLLAVIGLGEAVAEDRLELGEPGVPVAVKNTGSPLMPLGDAVAVSVFGPGVAARTQDVTVAMPSLPVAIGPVGLTVPLFTPVVKVTSTPPTGFPLASLTITEGGEETAVPAAADWVMRLLLVIDAGAPGVMLKASLVVPVTEEALVTRV